MSGFANAVVGGVGKLVRKWIQSPDYQTGVSGWSVNQDGSAEFNDVTVRGNVESSTIILEGASGEVLIYSGTPAAGNLLAAISGAAGNDPYGNAYLEGLTLFTQSGQPGFTPGIFWTVPQFNNFTNVPEINNTWDSSVDYDTFTVYGAANPVGLLGHAVPQLQLQCESHVAGTTYARLSADYVYLDGADGIQIANGMTGLAYSEIINVLQPVNNNTRTNVLGSHITAVALNSSYGSAWNVGGVGNATWTCPQSGYYDISAFDGWGYTRASYTSDIRFIYSGTVYPNGSILIYNGEPTFPETGNLSASGVYFNAGDTLTISSIQASGANQNLSFYLSISRRLT